MRKVYGILVIIFCVVFTSILLYITFFQPKSGVKKLSENSSTVVFNRKELKLRPHLPRKFIPKIEVKNLNLWGEKNGSELVGDDAIVLMGLRWKNITDAVEERYMIEMGGLFGSMSRETDGIEFLGNAQNDGGFGIIHIQPATACEFGLKIFGNCKAMIDEKHSKNLKEKIEFFGPDYNKLIPLDDRFQPVYCLDAAGRIIAFHMVGEKSFKEALGRYYGTNKSDIDGYVAEVKRYERFVNNPDSLEALRQRFNAMNPDLFVNGKSADFDAYIKVYQDRNEECFALAEYKKLPPPKTKEKEQ